MADRESDRKPRRRKGKVLFTKPRILRLHGSFLPDEDSVTDRDSLMNFWIESQDPITRAKNRALDREEEEWNELSQAIDKVSPIIKEVLNGNQKGSEWAGNAEELIPDPELRKKVYEWYVECIKRTPEQAQQERAELEERRRAVDIRAKQNRNSRLISNSLMRLADAVEADEPGAPEALLEAATTAAALLSMASRRNPERFKRAAENSGLWPVLAKPESGWEKEAQKHVADLELGKVLVKFKTRLRKLRGSDAHLPARRWAKAAVRAIDETKWRLPFFNHIVSELGGSGEWAEFAVARGWQPVKVPTWAFEAMKLQPLSPKTLDEWKAIVREIVREESPDFHLHEDWAMQRATAEANGKTSPGEIQNAILDDIVSALKRLAPEEEC